MVKKIELNELLSEGCRETTEIDLRGEYLFISNQVDGENVVSDAAFILNWDKNNDLLVEHEDGRFIEHLKHLEIKHKKICSASFYKGEAECFNLTSKILKK